MLKRYILCGGNGDWWQEVVAASEKEAFEECAMHDVYGIAILTTEVVTTKTMTLKTATVKE